MITLRDGKNAIRIGMVVRPGTPSAMWIERVFFMGKAVEAGDEWIRVEDITECVCKAFSWKYGRDAYSDPCEGTFGHTPDSRAVIIEDLEASA